MTMELTRGERAQEVDMRNDAYSTGPLDVDVRKEGVSRLSLAMTAKRDDVLREAVTRFLGHDKWTPEELKDRGVIQYLPTGVEVFCLDGGCLYHL